MGAEKGLPPILAKGALMKHRALHWRHVSSLYPTTYRFRSFGNYLRKAEPMPDLINSRTEKQYY
jgi:hypothetical protein